MIRKFASRLTPNEYAYAFDSEAWTSDAEVDPHFRMFSTYGDGICQHSGDWSIHLDHLADYLASLAVAMRDDDELLQRSAFSFLRAPSVEKIEFCAGVIFKESDRSWDKRRYYSVSERKLSSSRSKEHDKRYEEIREWNNGTPEAIYRMLTPDYCRALEWYCIADAIRDWVLADGKRGYMQLTAQFLKWFDGDRERAQDMRHAFGACRALAQAYNLRCEADTHLENLKPSQVAEPAAEEVA